MPTALLGAGVGIAGSAIGSGKQASAIKSAATTQADAENYAAQLQSQASTNALDFNKQQYNTSQTQLAPYISAGDAALTQLTSGTVPGGQFSTSPTYTNPAFSFNPSDLTSTPGYQFQLQQGNEALQANASATGKLGGNQIAAAEQFGQGLAGTTYNNAYAQALQGYGANTTNNLNTYQSQVENQQNQFQRLAAQAGYGVGATNTSVGAGNAFAQGASNNLLTSSNNIANSLTSGANALAAGQVGQANVLGNAYAGVGNTLSQYLQGLTSSSYKPTPTIAGDPALDDTALSQGGS